jgi:hypothetical protein
MWTLLKSTATAGLFGLASLTTQVPPASAADIYDKYGPRASSPYDDPRYADIYSHPAPQPPRYAEPRYVEPPPPYVEQRYERPYAYHDEPVPVPRDRYGYLKPVQPPLHHGAQPVCVPHGEIKRSLIAEGWRDFQDLEFRGDVAVVQARRPNGQPYSLKVDRCTGDIVHARPLDDRPIPYAYRERDRYDRYDRRTY